MITDNAANTSFEQNTLPFGTELAGESSSGTNPTNQRFTSYDRSTVASLDYAVNRSYSSGQGRFTTVDPIGMSSVKWGNPQSLNLYAYVKNNPIDYIDPTGLSWILVQECQYFEIISYPENGDGGPFVSQRGWLCSTGWVWVDDPIVEPPPIGEPPAKEPPPAKSCAKHESAVIYKHIRLEQKIVKKSLEFDSRDTTDIGVGCLIGIGGAILTKSPATVGKILTDCGIVAGIALISRIIAWAAPRLAYSAYLASTKRREILEKCKSGQYTEEELLAIENRGIEDESWWLD